jgi:hypothetical protein
MLAGYFAGLSYVRAPPCCFLVLGVSLYRAILVEPLQNSCTGEKIRKEARAARAVLHGRQALGGEMQGIRRSKPALAGEQRGAEGRSSLGAEFVECRSRPDSPARVLGQNLNTSARTLIVVRFIAPIPVVPVVVLAKDAVMVRIVMAIELAVLPFMLSIEAIVEPLVIVFAVEAPLMRALVLPL